MDNVEKVVAEDATFDRTGEMVNSSINEAGYEGKWDKIQVFDEGKVESCKKERNHNDAKCSRPFCVKVIVDFPLQKSSKKSLFRNGDKEQVGD